MCLSVFESLTGSCEIMCIFKSFLKGTLYTFILDQYLLVQLQTALFVDK